MIEVDQERFESLVADALDQIPEALFREIENVAVIVEDEDPEQPDILGKYDGVSLRMRSYDYSGVMPDRIFIYRLPLCAMCSSEEELVEEVLITVVHEVAHYFGFDDDALHQLGWG